jgi:hypothetical protein
VSSGRQRWNIGVVASGTVTEGKLPAHVRARASFGPQTCVQVANPTAGHHILVCRATLLCQLARVLRHMLTGDGPPARQRRLIRRGTPGTGFTPSAEQMAEQMKARARAIDDLLSRDDHEM